MCEALTGFSIEGTTKNGIVASVISSGLSFLLSYIFIVFRVDSPFTAFLYIFLVN